MKILVVGGCIVDFIARPLSIVAKDTSNEAEITWSPGGAARNVAENLARLVGEVTLVTDLGGDLLGRFLMEHLQNLGIEVRLAHRERTGLYLAFLDREGNLDKGFCHTATETVTLEAYLAVLPDLASYDGVVLDANLGEEALGGLSARCRELGIPYALETVANERARRVLPALAGCAFIKPDRQEAAALTGLPCRTRDDAVRCARALRDMGARSVLVSQGGDGFYFENESYQGHFHPAPTKLVDVTGAGDALFTVVFTGMLMELPLKRVMEAGRKAAALACASPTAVSPRISPALFEKGSK